MDTSIKGTGVFIAALGAAGNVYLFGEKSMWDINTARGTGVGNAVSNMA